MLSSLFFAKKHLVGGGKGHDTHCVTIRFRTQSTEKPPAEAVEPKHPVVVSYGFKSVWNQDLNDSELFTGLGDRV